MTRSLLRRRAAWIAVAGIYLVPLLYAAGTSRSLVVAAPAPKPDPRFEPLRQAMKWKDFDYEPPEGGE